MADVFWTGEIAFMKRIILNINGMIAWILGNMKDTETMKDDIKIAYNGERASDVDNYDVFGWNHYAKVADMLLEDIIIQGKDQFFQASGLCDIKLKQSVWQDSFQDSHEMYEFIASSTANFYASFVPDQVIGPVLDDIRQYFVKQKTNRITLDVVFAYGKKAGRLR
jgi:hypothetical protein